MQYLGWMMVMDKGARVISIRLLFYLKGRLMYANVKVYYDIKNCE